MEKIKVLIVTENTLNTNEILKEVLNNKEYFEVIGTLGDINVNNISFIDVNNPVNLSKIVTEILHTFGVPAHILGYQYIRSAIMLMLEDESMTNITKVLYPTIANNFKTTINRVERAIRHAIERTWLNGNRNELDKMFNRTITNSRKPTNSEFIMTIVDSIKTKYNL